MFDLFSDELENKYNINRYTLEFSKEKEDEYLEHRFNTSIKSIRRILVVIIILYIIGNTTDILLNSNPNTLYLQGFNLVVIICSFLIGLFTTYLDIFKKYHQFILAVLYLMSGFGLLNMMFHQPDNFIYPMGMLTAIPLGYYLLTLKYFYSSVASILLLLIISILMPTIGSFNYYNIFAYIFFYSIAIIMNIITTYSIEQYLRKNFIQKQINEYEKNKALEIIKSSEDKLDFLINNAFDGIYILNNNRFEYVNEAFCDIAGYIAEEITTPGFDIYNVVTPESKKVLLDKYQSRKLGKYSTDKYELEFRDKDGRINYLEVTTTYIGDSSNIRVFGVLRDITSRVEAQKNLEIQNNLRALLVEISVKFINLNIQDMHKEIYNALEILAKYVKADRAYIFDCDSSTKICNNTYEYCNEGIEPYKDELQNIKLTTFVYDGLVNNGWLYIEDVAKIEDIETKNILEPQGIKSLFNIPMINDGELIGFIGFDFVRNYHKKSEIEMQLLTVFSLLLVNLHLKVNNEKQLVEAKAKAEDSDKLKSAFLANLSHEIRTPMNGIIGFMNLLKLPDLSDEEHGEYIDMVKSSSNRLITTLEDIIEISNIDSGNLAVYIDSYNLIIGINEIVDQFEDKIMEKGLTYKVNIDIPEQDAIVETDKKLIERILFHLISNAIKYTNEGSIEVGLNINSGKLIIYVKDTGIGISNLVKDRIFERFVQGDLSISRSYEGSGLGLSIVKEYADLLGYVVRFESEVNEGSVFYLEI